MIALFLRRVVVLLLSALVTASPALAQGLVGDWIGRMNGGFKVRIHFERAGAPSEYNDIEQTMSPTALKIITGWLWANVLTHRH